MALGSQEVTLWQVLIAGKLADIPLFRPNCKKRRKESILNQGL